MVGSNRRQFRLNRMFTQTIEAPGCRPTSNAFASICEVEPNLEPKEGSAGMKIYNVIPRHDHIRVRGEVDWDEPLHVRVSVLWQ